MEFRGCQEHFTLANTDAPIPTVGVRKSPESANRGKTPEQIERYFSASFGPEIPDDYVEKIILSLRSIRRFFEARPPNSNNILIKNSVFSFLLIYDGKRDSVKMSDIMQRPCVEAIGIPRLFVLQLILCCQAHHHNLVIYDPTDDMILHLNNSSPETREISREGGVLKRQLMLMSGDMDSVNLRFLDVGHLLSSAPAYELRLNVEGFPSAFQLNDLEKVNKRIKKNAKLAPKDDVGDLISSLSLIPSEFLLLENAGSRKTRDFHDTEPQLVSKRIKS